MTQRLKEHSKVSIHPGASSSKKKQNQKPLTRLIKKKRERTQINKIRSERGEITTDTTELQRIVRNYYEQLYAKKFEKLAKIDKLLEYIIFQNCQEEAESLNRLITADKTKAVIKKLPTHESPG